MARFNQVGGAAVGRHTRRRVSERTFRSQTEARAFAEGGSLSRAAASLVPPWMRESARVFQRGDRWICRWDLEKNGERPADI